MLVCGRERHENKTNAPISEETRENEDSREGRREDGGKGCHTSIWPPEGSRDMFTVCPSKAFVQNLIHFRPFLLQMLLSCMTHIRDSLSW